MKSLSPTVERYLMREFALAFFYVASAALAKNSRPAHNRDAVAEGTAHFYAALAVEGGGNAMLGFDLICALGSAILAQRFSFL